MLHRHPTAYTRRSEQAAPRRVVTAHGTFQHLSAPSPQQPDSAHAHDGPDTGEGPSGRFSDVTMERRTILRGLVVTGLTFGSLSSPRTARAAFPEGSPLPWTSAVPATLTVREYQEIIMENRPMCWKSIAQQVQGTQFQELAESLDGGPFADLLQAAFFIPWALLQRDEFVSAVDMRKAFNDFESHVLDLQQAALGAAIGQTEPATVQQAFILMSASMDSFLAAIPTAYLRA